MLGIARPTENSKTKANIKTVYHICEHWRANFTLRSWKLCSAKSCFYDNHFMWHIICMFAFVFEFSVGCAAPNLEGRISLYDHENYFWQNHVFHWKANFTLWSKLCSQTCILYNNFFAGKWDLQLFSRVSGLTSCGMHLKSPYAPWFWSDWQTQAPTFS